MPKRAASYGFKGRAKKAPRKGKKTALKKKYNAVKRKQFTRKMRRTVRAARSRAISSLAVANQPVSQLVKFTMTYAETYRMSSSFAASEYNGHTDQNSVFPANGIEIHQNSLYDPIKLANMVGTTQHHANGFEEMSRKYKKYRVIGSKTTVRFRRMGGLIPLTSGGTSTNVQFSNASGGDTYPTGSQAANLGTMFDPSTQDPLLCMVVDRTAFQDDHSGVPDEAIDEYMDLAKWKHLKGIKWRELKAGPGERAVIIEKFSERGLTSAAGDTDHKTNNTGLFHDVDATGAQLTSGSNPPVVDKMLIKMKPFDKLSLKKQQYSCARVMVTIDQEFLAVCSEPRYAYSNL